MCVCVCVCVSVLSHLEADRRTRKTSLNPACMMHIYSTRYLHVHWYAAALYNAPPPPPHTHTLQAVLERAQEELAKDREVFAEKSRKLDAIMKQVQGLQEP